MRSSLITIAIIVILLAFAATLLPRGFSEDISVIGQGHNVAVLVHNKESVQSLELMTLLNRVRSDYEDRVEFRAVDDATDKGRTFMNEQGVGSGVVVLFGPDGTRRDVLFTNKESEMHAALNDAFGL